MSEERTPPKKFYFSTHDLLIMAVLAALGGVASTYINTLSDAVHAVLGFPGATQWAAGLHVVWIVLAIAITGKPGTGVLTGALKGSVELMSGNSHGIIILLIDLVAGLLVDFGFLLFRNKRTILPFLVAGGLATASNVLVFQIFATIPTNILAVSAILVLFFVAMVSGLIFAGIIPFFLVNSLAKAGIVKIPEQTPRYRRIGWWVLLGVFILASLLAVFLRINLQGPDQITISGAVENSLLFPSKDLSIEKVTRQMDYRGVPTKYTGYTIADIINAASPDDAADLLLIEASDGYAFLISFDELNSNPNILLVQNGQGKKATFDVVGPESSKAWIRNVTLLNVIVSKGLVIVDSAGVSTEFDPDAWVSEMDSIQVALPDGSQKLQGVPVWKVIDPLLNGSIPADLKFISEVDTLTLTWDEISQKDDLRIFTEINDTGLNFVLADMSGKVLLYPLTKIEIR